MAPDQSLSTGMAILPGPCVLIFQSSEQDPCMELGWRQENLAESPTWVVILLYMSNSNFGKRFRKQREFG